MVFTLSGVEGGPSLNPSILASFCLVFSAGIGGCPPRLPFPGYPELTAAGQRDAVPSGQPTRHLALKVSEITAYFFNFMLTFF